jgi:predicted SAM-dependent methyltransferase
MNIPLPTNLLQRAKVRILIGTIVRSRPIFLSRKTCDYLNIGCGPNIFDTFYNLDYTWRPGIDACWDLNQELPFPDESFLGCFSEHCLEHVPLPVFNRVVADVYRVLRPGGCFRIVVPDAEIYLRGYLSELDGNAAKIPYRDLFEEKTALMSVNRIFRGHGHQYAWDFNTIRIPLAEAGFVEIRKSKFGEGRDPKLLIDMEHRAVESLYVEAIKPHM